MDADCAQFRLSLNGTAVRIHGLPPQTTLLDFVRSQGLTGAKEGCAEGECGACAVLLISQSPGENRAVCRAVNSCLVPLPAVAGREVFTVEGLSENGTLAEVQNAMAAAGGSQCGYCTPGFVVSMFAEQHRCDPDHRDLHALGGNLCRCTGYRPIRDAFLSLGHTPEGRIQQRLLEPASPPQRLRYRANNAGFSTPLSLDEALRLAAETPDSRFVAGNTDLGVVTNLRDTRFPDLISLQAVPELKHFTETPDAVEIGAALTLTEIGDRWQTAPPVFREWLPLFASLLIRNSATLGGNLATASPIGDSAPLLLALDAAVRIASLQGDRLIPLTEFFCGYRKTALNPGEILSSVRIPKPFPHTARFFKVAKRSLDDISTVAVCIAISGRGARIALGGVAATPLRVLEAEDFLSNGDIEGAQQALEHTLHPLSDHRGSAAYRLAMAKSLLAKFRAEHEGQI